MIGLNERSEGKSVSCDRDRETMRRSEGCLHRDRKTPTDRSESIWLCTIGKAKGGNRKQIYVMIGRR